VNAGEKVSCELVVACGDGTKVLEFIEEALDEIALAVERKVTRRRRLAIGFGRDHRGDFSLGKPVAERIGIVCLIADESLRVDPFEQWLRASQIMDLTWREHHIDGIAERIDEDVNFGAQSAAGSADRLFAVFFRAPALCW
jgi:hypothetical protein